MIVFYVRQLMSGPQFIRGMDSLSSFNGTQKELADWLHGSPGLTFAVFDETTTPPTLVYKAKAVKLTFKEAREIRPDFPEFYIEPDGSIWASEQLDDGWGKFMKNPIFASPAYLKAMAEMKRLGLYP